MRYRFSDAAKMFKGSNETDSVTHQPPMVTRSFSPDLLVTKNKVLRTTVDFPSNSTSYLKARGRMVAPYF